MKMELTIDGRDIWEYNLKELVAMKYDKVFNINEKAMIEDVITCKIEGGNDDDVECDHCGDALDKVYSRGVKEFCSIKCVNAYLEFEGFTPNAREEDYD